MIVLILFIISNVDTFISSITTDLKMLISSYEHFCSWEHCFAMKCSLYQNGGVGFWNKAFKKADCFDNVQLYTCICIWLSYTVQPFQCL